jgi:hypothetical protein
MTEAERLLKSGEFKETPRQRSETPAELYLNGCDEAKEVSQCQKRDDFPSVSSFDGFKIGAVLVFVLLILIGTYFAKVANTPFVGFAIGAVAFIVAPQIWRMGKRP